MEHGARGGEGICEARRGRGHLLRAHRGFLDGEPAGREHQDEGERERIRDRAPGGEQARVQRVRPEARGRGGPVSLAEEVAEVRGRAGGTGGIVASHVAIHRRRIRRPRRFSNHHDSASRAITSDCLLLGPAPSDYDDGRALAANAFLSPF